MSSDQTTTIAELRRVVDAFVAERKWEKFHDAKNLSMALAIEAAELMEHFQWARSEELADVTADPARKAEIQDELADIFCFLLSLTSTLEIDLTAALEQKMVKNRAKYPADRYQGWYEKPRG